MGAAAVAGFSSGWPWYSGNGAFTSGSQRSSQDKQVQKSLPERGEHRGNYSITSRRENSWEVWSPWSLPTPQSWGSPLSGVMQCFKHSTHLLWGQRSVLFNEGHPLKRHSKQLHFSWPSPEHLSLHPQRPVRYKLPLSPFWVWRCLLDLI